MKSSLFCDLEDERIDVQKFPEGRVNVCFHPHLSITMTQSQMLDLAMKIQSVVNSIDRENKEAVR